MTRRMADSITSTDIPILDPRTGRPWALIAGYIDGRYVWSAADWARFPSSRHVRIAVLASTNAGDVIDREPGDATPDEAVSWVVRRRVAGHPAPTVYCSYADWAACQAAFRARNVAMPNWWISGYPSPVDFAGHPVIPVGAVAHQYTDAPGGHWDETLVADYWPGIDPPTIRSATVFNFVCNSDTFTKPPIVTGVPDPTADNPNVLLLLGGGYAEVVTWADVRAKDHTYGGDGTGSVLGLSSAAYAGYVTLDTAVRARDAHLMTVTAVGVPAPPTTYDIATEPGGVVIAKAIPEVP